MVSIADEYRENISFGSRAREREVEPAPRPPRIKFSTALWLAVLIEVGSVTINAMAAMLNVGQYYDTAKPIFGNVAPIMAGVPFIVMALVELCKIPLTIIFMNIAGLWRGVMLIGLILMSAITFESLLMGLERANSLQARKIEMLRIDIRDTEAKMFGNKDEKAMLRTEREALNAEIVSINEQQRAEEALLDARFKGVLEGVNQRRRALEEQIKNNREAERDALKMHTERALKTPGGTKATVAENIQKQAAAERATLQAELNRITDPADLATERHAIQDRFNRQRAPIEAQLRQLASAVELPNSDLRHQFERQNAELSILINDNQLYRMAAGWYGHDNVSEVTTEQVKSVAVIWFSSIAALVAFAGPLLAMGSVVVTRVQATPEESRAKRMYYNALRTLLARLRRRARVQVIREVKVEVPGAPRVIKVVEEIEKTVKVVEPVPIFADLDAALALHQAKKN